MSILKQEGQENEYKSNVHEFRALPRRRKGDNEEKPTLFLQKAFSLVESCPVDIACWSKVGDTFVIKNTDKFSKEIIPKWYKHNNISSFVRQLHFYGFRKVKTEFSLNQEEWWEFHHPHFQRGKSSLLSNIKRSSHHVDDQHHSSEDSQNNSLIITDLTKEVSSLKDRVSCLDETILEISNALQRITIQGHENNAQIPQAKNSLKKRRLTHEYGYPDEAHASISLDMSAMRVDDPDEYDFDAFFPIHSHLQHSQLVVEDISSSDFLSGENCLAEGDDDDLFEFMSSLNDGDMNEGNAAVTPSPAPQASGESVPLPLPLLQDVGSIITSLSPVLQERFVDKLAEVIGMQLASHFKPADSLHLQPSQCSTSEASALPIEFKLASAALGAFVASLSKSNHADNGPGSHSHSQSSLSLGYKPAALRVEG